MFLLPLFFWVSSEGGFWARDLLVSCFGKNFRWSPRLRESRVAFRVSKIQIQTPTFETETEKMGPKKGKTSYFRNPGKRPRPKKPD